VTASRDGDVRIWDLRPDSSPTADLEVLAHLLNSRQIDSTGGLVPIPTHTLRETWLTLRAAHPEAFRTSRWAIEAWHRNKLDTYRATKHWFAALQHLTQLQELLPNDPHLAAVRLEIQGSLEAEHTEP
jgi:hypothetical protein